MQRLQLGGLKSLSRCAAHDLLAINGIAKLSGTLQVIALNNFRLSPGGEITSRTANAGVERELSTLSKMTWQNYCRNQIVYLPDSVVLEVDTGSFKRIWKNFLRCSEYLCRAALDSAVTIRASNLGQ